VSIASPIGKKSSSVMSGSKPQETMSFFDYASAMSGSKPEGAMSFFDYAENCRLCSRVSNS